MNSVLNNLAGMSMRDAPLGKIEILQDLDLFYIKQLAHNFKVSCLSSTIYCKQSACSSSR